MADAPDNLADIRRDLQRAIDLIAEKTDDYIAAREYYDGTRAEVADSEAARAVIRQSKTTPLSFSHIPVDVIADKIELASITAKGAAAKRVLETWLDENDIDDEAIDWVKKACMFGDYYVVTDPTGLDEDGSITPEDIDSVGMSPLSTIVVYDRKTGREALYGAHFWDAGTKAEPKTKAILYYDNGSLPLVADGEKVTQAELFEYDVPTDADEDDDDFDAAFLPHDGGRMLIAHLPVGGKPYGIPVHRKAYGPQDAITKVSANNLVNVDRLGLPSRWALVDPATEIDDDLDDDFGTDGPNTVAADSDGRRDATTARRTRPVPGAIDYLRGVRETGTYEAATSDPFLSNLEFYIRAMAVACGIPLFEFDLKGEQPSGESRRRAEARANRAAARIKRQATSFFRAIADTVLGVVGATGEVTVTFTPSETATDKDGLELVGIKIKNGVPVRQALLEAGYTDEQVTAWYPTGAPALTPDLVTILATALAALGNAQTLGAINARGIEAMIPEVFDYVAAAAAEGPLVGVETRPRTATIVTDAGSRARAA